MMTLKRIGSVTLNVWLVASVAFTGWWIAASALYHLTAVTVSAAMLAALPAGLCAGWLATRHPDFNGGETTMFTELDRLLRAAGMPDLADKVCGGLAALQIIALARARPGFTAELHEWERAYTGNDDEEPEPLGDA